jgi:hypothetical protein
MEVVMHRELLQKINIKDGKIIDKFPLKELLENSLYYPACGRDGDPVWCVHRETQSFFYADYGVTQEQIEESLYGTGRYGENITFRGSDPVSFKGYKVIGEKKLMPKELDPTGVVSLTTKQGQMQFVTDKSYACGMLKDWIKKPFAKWYILERQSEFDDTHGPERFSLVFICADGVTTYKTLYNFNQTAPKYLTIYNSGDGFGFNWDNFQSEDGELCKTVFSNIKTPEALLSRFDIWTNVFAPSEKTLFDELEECMSNVKSKMSDPVSFDVFLKELDEEIAKSDN